MFSFKKPKSYCPKRIRSKTCTSLYCIYGVGDAQTEEAYYILKEENIDN
jgi:hypothetical protein